MAETSIHDLPEDCLAQVISFTTPINACKSSTITTMFHNAAESDFVWDKFLPCDYRDIVSNLVTPMEFSSKKDLFFKLSAPLLIEGGNKVKNSMLKYILKIMLSFYGFRAIYLFSLS